jgi:hypothetical protein
MLTLANNKGVITELIWYFRHVNTFILISFVYCKRAGIFIKKDASKYKKVCIFAPLKINI